MTSRLFSIARMRWGLKNNGEIYHLVMDLVIDLLIESVVGFAGICLALGASNGVFCDLIKLSDIEWNEIEQKINGFKECVCDVKSLAK